MDSKQKTILVIDDDAFLLSMYDIKFKKAGFNVIVSAGGNDALRKLREGLLPDAITVDIVMPDLDGIQFLQEMRRLHLAPLAAIIVLSNQSQSEDIENAKKYGIDGYIVKATTIPSEVVTEVEKIIQEKKK
ncbi:MAG: response regulator [Candidatus Taylorbacteria bacterium]